MADHTMSSFGMYPFGSKNPLRILAFNSITLSPTEGGAAANSLKVFGYGLKTVPVWFTHVALH